MTTSRTAAGWRQAAATTAIFVAAVSVGTATAMTSSAEPKKPGSDEMTSCLLAHYNAINRDWTKISSQAFTAIWEDCCTGLGGIFNEVTEACYLPDGETYRKPDQGSPPPTPPPSRVAPLPPGATNIN